MNGWLKALLGVLVIAVIVSLFTLFRGSRPVGSENLIGQPLPAFAAPLASGRLEGDANIYTPDQARAVNATAACEVRIEGAFNSCDALKGDAIVMFFNSSKRECAAQVDTLDRLLRGHRDVDAVVVAFDQPEETVRKFVDSRDWRVPVAIDRDGAVASLYSVAGCPSTFFASNGRINAVELGVLSAAGLERGLASTPASASGGE